MCHFSLRLTQYSLLVTLFLSVIALSAAEAYAVEKPLVVIRFSERVVPFQGALSRAVKQTLATVPDATFDIVSIYPAPENFFGSVDQGIEAKVDAVKNVLLAQGVTEYRITTRYESDDSVGAQEVRVFVK